MKYFHGPGMRNYRLTCLMKAGAAVFFFLIFFSPVSNGQMRYRTGGDEAISFGVHFDPVISWFSTDIETVRNEGARPGLNFGISYNRYFGPNYSFSTGISLISAGGRLVSSETTLFKLKNHPMQVATVQPNEAIVYRIQYMSVPLGLKLQTNQIGYNTFFSDIGIDPKIVVGGKADIPSLDLRAEGANGEVRLFNLSYHIIAGIEYSIGGSTAIVIGIGFDNNFFDITKDNGEQPEDRVSHKLISFRLGVNF